MATPNTTVNYEDKRFQTVEADKKVALSEAEKTYGGMINQSDKFFNAQIDASKQWAETQSKNQQERSDFAIEQIEQQKDQAEKDYKKEQSGAYVDYQKESNRYGANAEQMASQGFGNTGYSESSQVSLFNTYQNRVATAREAYQSALLNYNNAIKDARLQNNSALAEIAYNALKEQLALGLEGFQYKNDLIIQKANKKTELDEIYHGRYQDVLQQINTENAMAEEIRQFNKSHQLEIDKYNEGIRQFNEEIAELKKQNKHDNEMDIANLELARDELVLARDKLKEDKRQFNITNKNSKGSGGGGGGGSSGGGGGGGSIDKPKGSSGGSSFVDKIKEVFGGGSGGGEPTPNMSSILSLGYGPISASKLNSLVESGKVKEYEKNGQLYYKKA